MGQQMSVGFIILQNLKRVTLGLDNVVAVKLICVEQNVLCKTR